MFEFGNKSYLFMALAGRIRRNLKEVRKKELVSQVRKEQKAV